MPNRLLTFKEFYDDVEKTIAERSQSLPKKKREQFRRLAWMSVAGMFEAPIRGLVPAKRLQRARKAI